MPPRSATCRGRATLNREFSMMPQSTTCSVDGCERPVYARGWCSTHYEKQRLQKHELTAPPCSALDCDRPAWIRGRCRRHYAQLIRAEHPERAREAVRRYDEAHRELRRAQARARHKAHPGLHYRPTPAQHAAQQRVHTAVRNGTLERPNSCSACGCACKPHAHHTDYSKPLEVTWLCASCHKLTHINEKYSHD